MAVTFTSSFNINGKLSNAASENNGPEELSINAKCFSGINALTTCKNTNTQTSEAFNEDLPYYYNFNANSNAPWCLQCCGNSPSRSDKWSFSCVLDSVTAKLTNVYGYEFRFAKRAASPTDVTEIVRCPLKRAGCEYSTNGTLLSCRGNVGTYLQGYELIVKIKEYNVNFQYWRGVDSCSIRTFESNVSLAHNGIFTETIIMDYSSPSTELDNPQLAFLGLIVIVLASVILYFGRKQTCIVCQKKLIVCCQRCMVCRILGADTDPDLIRKLALKGAILQGTDKYSPVDVNKDYLQLTMSRSKLNRILPESISGMDHKASDNAYLNVRLTFKNAWGVHDKEETPSSKADIHSQTSQLVREIPPEIVLMAINYPVGSTLHQ
jgi:hypothetical protein